MRLIDIKYIKSPLNYVGGKYKLLPQIMPLFPKEINRFVDLFAGGCNVGINVQANTIICNDYQQEVIDLMKNLKILGTEKALHILKDTIGKYQLSKTNEEGFKRIRQDYNDGNRTWNMFYAMVTNAFNYQIRFNKSGNYNMPFGRNRSYFNPSLEENFVAFVSEIHNKNILFTDKDFRKIKVDKLCEDDFIYADPPYLITCASYNESDGWNEKCERDLLELLDSVNNKGVKFALSNVLESKGKSNDILKEWSRKYIIHKLDYKYNNCNYQKKEEGKNDAVEVLIANY